MKGTPALYLGGSTDILCIVTNGDVNTLKGDWLTDSVIAFWEEYDVSLHNLGQLADSYAVDI